MGRQKICAIEKKPRNELTLKIIKGSEINGKKNGLFE